MSKFGNFVGLAAAAVLGMVDGRYFAEPSTSKRYRHPKYPTPPVNDTEHLQRAADKRTRKAAKLSKDFGS